MAIATKHYIYKGKIILKGDELPEALSHLGYVEIKPEPEEAKDLSPLESMTAEELREIAEKRGIEVVGTGKNGRILKDDLIKAIEGV